MKFHAPIEKVPTKYAELQARIESLERDVFLPIECEDCSERKQVWDFLMWHYEDQLVITQQRNWLWVRRGDWTNDQPKTNRKPNGAANGRR